MSSISPSAYLQSRAMISKFDQGKGVTSALNKIGLGDKAGDGKITRGDVVGREAEFNQDMGEISPEARTEVETSLSFAASARMRSFNAERLGALQREIKGYQEQFNEMRARKGLQNSE